MKKILSILCSIILLVFLNNCAVPNQPVDPVVPALVTLSDLQGIVNGSTPAFVYKDGNGNYCIAWLNTAKDAIRFVFFDANFKYPMLKFANDAKGNATRINFTSWLDFKTFLSTNGWVQINPSQLPLHIVTGITSGLAWLAEILPTFPVIILFPEQMDIDQYYLDLNLENS